MTGGESVSYMSVKVFYRNVHIELRSRLASEDGRDFACLASGDISTLKSRFSPGIS